MSGKSENVKMKNNKLLPMIAGGLVLLLVIVLVLTSKEDSQGDVKESASNNYGDSLADTGIILNYEVDEGGNLIIPTTDITSEASFVDYDADGVLQQLFVVKASDDSIRVAFNTCQVCNGSPRAYFTQENDTFMCQNCGNRYSVDQVGKDRGGCNPIPITEENYEIVEDKIVIAKDFMLDYADAFTNWKKFDQ